MSMNMNMTRVEVLNGGNKVTVTEHTVDSLHMARQLALAKELKKDDEPFAVLNLNTLLARFIEWKTKLPRVQVSVVEVLMTAT